MIKKLIFAAGAGVGYVLGTRAGRQKYDAMVAKARQVMERPDVKEATEAVRTQANRIYDDGRQMIRDKVRDLGAQTDHRRAPTYKPATTPTSPPRLESVSER
jgi:hypothetical protein